ncbi:Diaminopimelate epimerase-like protein [Peniophora sp. CONT]|nr:Diaminopimelate epimerase-like protein [Peniophora sp. CONT]
MAPTKLPFAIVNAFSTSLSGGNPAAIILLTPSEDASLTYDQRITIASNLNQPMHMFVVPQPDGELGVRWFTQVRENMLCGHATLAASGLFFNEEQGSLMFVPGADTTQTLSYNGVTNKLSGTRVEDGKIEIALDVAKVDELDREDPRAVKLRSAVAAACGADVSVAYLGTGTGSYKTYCLIELDTDNLGALKVDFMRLLDSNFVVHVFTARPSPAAREAGVAFETRMFAPDLGVYEDHVCGSAHGLLVPYWDEKLKKRGGTMHSHQASARGGDLWVSLEGEKGLVKLAGHVVKVAEGTIWA